MQTDYAVPGGTLRENMTRKPGQKQLPEEHHGASFNWSRTHDVAGRFLGTQLDHDFVNGVENEKPVDVAVSFKKEINVLKEGANLGRVR
jgi:hypothetical protein